MTQREIEEICESHGIEPKGAELFNEDYIISTTGDLICGINWSYSIWDNMLLNVDWLEHLQHKNWYNVRTFFPAYIEALCRQGKECIMTRIENRTIILEPFKMREDEVQMQNYVTFLMAMQKMRDIVDNTIFNSITK